MKKMLAALLLGGTLLAASPVQAADPEAAKAILDQAIKAHGGSTAVAKSNLFTRTSSVVLTLSAGKTYVVEQTFSLPTKVRVTAKNEGKVVTLMVLNDDKAWQSVGGGPAMDVTEDVVKELKEENYVIWLSTLAPFVKESFDLDVLPELKVDGQPALGVKVSRKDRPTVSLYFDKKTNLLVKIDRQAREAGLKVHKEYFYSEPKEVDGVVMPTKEVVYMDGTKFTVASGSTYRFHRTVEDELFKKP